MARTCAVCESLYRTALEEALARGEPYRELTKRFKVSIGSMRRHRKGHMSSERGSDVAQEEEAMPATGEPVYLRFGELPKGGQSWNYELDAEEDGVSVFAGRKLPRGYAFDIPTELEYARLVPVVVQLLLAGRTIYLASGTEVGEGADGEPLLEDVTLKPLSRFASVELPDWLGEAGKRFSELWNKRRRNAGGNHSRELEEQAQLVEVQAARALYELHGDLYDFPYSLEEVEEAALEGAQRNREKRRRNRRGRKGEVREQKEEREAAGEAEAPCFLRFGELPAGGLSYNGKYDEYEEGTAVFRGKRTRSGYIFDLPDGQYREDEEEDTFSPLGACVVLFSYIVAGRQLFEASGEELAEPGLLGDPLLDPESIALKPISPFIPVSVPGWMGPEAQRLTDDWKKWRRNDGGRKEGHRKGSARRPPIGLLDQAARALAEAEARWDPKAVLFGSREERIRELKGLLCRG